MTPGADGLTQPFILEVQGQTEWCWAAVASAVHRYVDGQYLRQCEIVDRVRPGFSCCTNPTSTNCNQQAKLADVLERLGNRDGGIQPGTIDPMTLRAQLRANKPVCCGLVKAGLGHFVVVTNCFSAQGATIVTLKDPTFGDSAKTVSYADLRFGYRETSWRETYLTKSSGG
jgi:hypothetical protein